MKIEFTKLPDTDGTIKVSLDGGQSFTDYNIADIHESGIPLSDDQDYEKIQIRGPANLLKNLDIVSGVKVEGGSEVDLSDYVKKEYFYGEFYDGGCGYGYRITSSPDTFKNKDQDWYQNLLLSDGRSLGDLCSYDGTYNVFYGDVENKPTGQLYAIINEDGSKSEYYLLPTQYYLM